MSCPYCERGEEQYCPDRKTYGISFLNQGSYSTGAVWPEEFLFKIPESMPSEEAAPLMCAGASVFAPLLRGGVSSIDRVGVLGVGGLGHLAIQFAAKMGCEVVVLSGSSKKEDEARKLGATEFHVIPGGGGPPETLKSPIDHLLVTSAKQPDWKSVIEIMANGGTIHPITITMGEMTFPYMSIIDKALQIQGSLPTSRPAHRDMLKFAARHGVKPIISTFPMTLEGVREGIDALNQGKVRYRGVLVNQ